MNTGLRKIAAILGTAWLFALPAHSAGIGPLDQLTLQRQQQQDELALSLRQSFVPGTDSQQRLQLDQLNLQQRNEQQLLDQQQRQQLSMSRPAMGLQGSGLRQAQIQLQQQQFAQERQAQMQRFESEQQMLMGSLGRANASPLVPPQLTNLGQ
jgi:hypothetical protein